MAYSSIEEKKREKIGDDGQVNWSKFGVYVLISFILSILIGIIGSNFIFLTHLSQSELEKWLPTKSQNEEGGGFYKDARGGAGPRGGAGSCSLNKNEGFKFSGLSANWPYSMYKNEVFPGFIQSFKNWIAETTAASFMKYRNIVKSWLSLVSGLNNTIQMTILAPLTFIMYPIIYFCCFCISLYEAFFINVFWAIAGCFLLFVWPFISIISFLEIINYIGLFTFSPIYSNFNTIKNIFNCNLSSVTLLFGFLICMSSFLTLDSTTSGIASIIYIAMASMSLM